MERGAVFVLIELMAKLTAYPKIIGATISYKSEITIVLIEHG